ncbi:MAG: ribose 1,5-bisphosphate isomerase [Methanomicrobiales archaeon]|nr:ribose 1,5-bisphosphate isomerase [Methanomicrobiales archaeon]NYT21639.1 ribose 1,5-bisphosphate isomerase [Methanomicrobiales archaeon]
MTVSDTAEKIKKMEIRGAGRIARAAVAALRDEAERATAPDLPAFREAIGHAAGLLLATRPTAVSLPNAVHLVMGSLSGDIHSVAEAKERFSAACTRFITRSGEAVDRIGTIGARHIRDGDVVMTHCNSETALACLLQAHRNGTRFEVFATEVRPRNQGHLTIRTLNDAGIRTSFIVDSAARYFMKEVDLVVVGADAVTVNGAVINKIGTSQIALAAHESRTSVMVAAETYKFAPRTILGEWIEIEERDAAEVLTPEVAASLPRVRIRNPAFDVTPPGYIDLIVTEEGAIPPQMAYLIIRDYLGWEIGEFALPPSGPGAGGCP